MSLSGENNRPLNTTGNITSSGIIQGNSLVSQTSITGVTGNLTSSLTSPTITGSTKIKTNLIESISTNDDLYLDSLDGNIILNTLTNGGVRMIGNPTNLTWIQNCSYQSGSNRGACWGTFNIGGEYRPSFVGHGLDVNGFPNAWSSMWLNFQQFPGTHCIIVGGTTSTNAINGYSGSNGNAFYVTGNMECSGKLRFDSKTSDDIVTTTETLTSNDILCGNGVKTLKKTGIIYDGNKLTLPAKEIDGVTTLTCTNTKFGGYSTVGTDADANQTLKYPKFPLVNGRINVGII